MWLPLKGLIRACHPDATAAVTVISGLLAVAVGRGPGGVVAVVATVLASQLCVGWHNDWLDADRDALVERGGKPIPAGLVSRHTVGVSAVIAGVATALLGLLSGPAAALAIIVGLVGGLAYNWPLKATWASVLPYLVSFGALAAFVVLGLPGVPLPPWWMVVAGSLLGGGAHFANALPDLSDDTRTGVYGLPHRLGATGSWLAAAGLLLSASAVLAVGLRGRGSWLGLAVFVCATPILAVGWFAAKSPGSRAAFHAALVVAFADVVVLLLSGHILQANL